jgi:hypothetical protein
MTVCRDTRWLGTSTAGVVYQNHVLALIALDRSSSHLAEQVAVKTFLPVIAISSDRSDFNQYSLDLWFARGNPPGERHSQSFRGNGAGRCEPRRHPRISGIRQVFDWRFDSAGEAMQ